MIQTSRADTFFIILIRVFCDQEISTKSFSSNLTPYQPFRLNVSIAFELFFWKDNHFWVIIFSFMLPYHTLCHSLSLAAFSFHAFSWWKLNICNINAQSGKFSSYGMTSRFCFVLFGSKPTRTFLYFIQI